MLKPLLRTLPSLSGNITLACEINDLTYEENNTYETYIRSASLQPLQNNLYNRRININLINGMWEYDVAKFYKYYSNYFYKQNYMLLRDDFAKLDLTSYNSNTDSRNKDYEYGCKRISYKNTGYMFEFYAPVYMNSVDDIPDYFEITFKFENKEEKKIKVHINTESNINYLKVYIEKYLTKINRNVAYFISNTGRMIYYGIDVEHGGFVDIEDSHMSQYFYKNTTINKFDTELCAGFMNNKLIMRQVLPLSFIFNLEDILTSYDKKYFIAHKVNINAHYYKNSLKQKFYDFDINYVNKPIVDLIYAPEENRFVASKRQIENNTYKQDFNLLDNNNLFALHEKYIKNYYYTNAQTPMYTSWKMILSDDTCPYITNLNYTFSNLINNTYGQFPKIFLKYDYKEYAKIEGSNLNIIDSKQQNLDNNIYTILQNSYISNWYTLINRYQHLNNNEQQLLNIIQDNNNWSKVENNYAYYKGILYNFANCAHTTDIDYFAVFINPVVNITNEDETEMYRHTILEDCAIGEYGDISLNKSLYNMSNITLNDVNKTDFDKSLIDDTFDFDNLFTFNDYNSIKNGDRDANVKKINSTIITSKYNEHNTYKPNDLIDNVLYTSIETTNNKEKNTYVRYLDVFNQESLKTFFDKKQLNIVLDLNDDLYKKYYVGQKQLNDFENNIVDVNKNTLLNNKTLYEVINQILSKYIIDNSLTELYSIVINTTNNFRYLLWRFTSLMLKKTNLYTINNINNANTYHGETFNYIKDIIFSQYTLFDNIENSNKHKWNIFVDNNGQVYEANLYVSLSSLKSIIEYTINNIRLEKEQYQDDDPNKAILDRHRYAIGDGGLVNTILKNSYSINDLKFATYTAHYIMNHLFDWIVEYLDSCTKYEFVFNDIELRNDMTIDSFYALINEIQINKSNNKLDTLTINNLWPFTSSELLLKHINNNNNSLPTVHFIKNGYVEQEFKLKSNDPFNIITTSDVTNYHKVLFIDAAYLNVAERHKFIDQSDDKNQYMKYYKFIKDIYGVPYTFFTNNNVSNKNIIEHEYSRYINFNVDSAYEIPNFDVTNILGIYSNNLAITKGPQYFFDLQNIQLAENIKSSQLNINQFLKYYHDNNNPIDVSFIYTPLKVSLAEKQSNNVSKNIKNTQNIIGINYENISSNFTISENIALLNKISYSYDYINTILLNTNKLSSKTESFGTLKVPDINVMQLYYKNSNGYERVLNNEPTYVNLINTNASEGSIDGSYMTTYNGNYIPSGNIDNVHDIIINNLYQYLSTILTQSIDSLLPKYDIRYNKYFAHTDRSSYGTNHLYENKVQHNFIDRISYINEIDNNVCFHTVLSRIIPNNSLDRLKFEIQIGAPITFKSDILKKFNPVMNSVLCDGKYDFVKDITTKYDENRISRFYKYNINDSNIYNILITHAMSESKNIESWRNLNSIYFSYPMLYDNMMKLFIDDDDVYMFYGSPFLILPGILPFDNNDTRSGIDITYNDNTQYVQFGSIPFINEGYFDDDIYIHAFYDDHRLYEDIKDLNIWEDYLTLTNWLDVGVDDETEKRLRIKYNIPDDKFTKDQIYRTIKLRNYISEEFYDGAKEFYENRKSSILEEINDVNKICIAILINYKENESDEAQIKFHNVINGIYFSINKSTGDIEMPANKMAFDDEDEYNDNIKLYSERYEQWLNNDYNMFTYSPNRYNLSEEDRYYCAKIAITAKYNDYESWFPIPNDSYKYIATSGYYNILSFWKSLIENVKYEYRFTDNRDFNLNKQTSLSNELKLDSRYTNTMSLITQLKNKANYNSIKQISDTNKKQIYLLYDSICDLYDNNTLRQNYDKYNPKLYNSNSHALFMFTDLSFNEDFIHYSCIRPESINDTIYDNRLCPIDSTKLSLYVYPNMFICSEFATLQDISNYIKHKDSLRKIISNETNSTVKYNEYDFAHMSSTDKVYDDNVRIALVSSLKNSYLHNARNFTQVLKYYKANNTNISIDHIKEYTKKTIDSLVDQAYCYDKTWQNCVDMLYNELVIKVKDIVDKNKVNINNSQLSTEEMGKITDIDNASIYYENFYKLISTVANIRKEISQLPEIMYINYIMQQLIILSTSNNQINAKDIINHLDEYPTLLANTLDGRYNTITDNNVQLYAYVDSSYNNNYENHKVSSNIINNNRIKTLYYNGLVTDTFVTMNYFNKKYAESEYNSNALTDTESYKIIHNILSQCNFDNFIKQTKTIFKSNEFDMYDMYYESNKNTEYSLYDLVYKEHNVSVSLFNEYEYLYEYSVKYAPSSLSFENTYNPWVKYESYYDSLNRLTNINTIKYLNHSVILNLIESSDVFTQKSIDEMFKKYPTISNEDYLNIGNDALYNIVGLDITAIYKMPELNNRINLADRNYIIDSTIQIDTDNNNLHKILYDIILPLAMSMNVYRKLLETIKLYKVTNRDNNISIYDNVESFKFEKIYDGKYVSSFISTEFENHINNNDDLVMYTNVKSLWSEYANDNHNKNYQFRYIFENSEYVVNNNNYFKHIHEIIPVIENHYMNHLVNSNNVYLKCFNSFYIDLYAKKQLLPLDEYLINNIHNENYQYYLYQLCEREDNYSSLLSFDKESSDNNLTNIFDENVTNNMLNINDDSNIHYAKLFNLTESNIYKNNTDRKMFESLELSNYIKMESCNTNSVYLQYMNATNETPYNVFTYQKPNTTFAIQLNNKQNEYQHELFANILSKYIINDLKYNFNESDLILSYCNIILTMINIILSSYEIEDYIINDLKEQLTRDNLYNELASVLLVLKNKKISQLDKAATICKYIKYQNDYSTSTSLDINNISIGESISKLVQSVYNLLIDYKTKQSLSEQLDVYGIIYEIDNQSLIPDIHTYYNIATICQHLNNTLLYWNINIAHNKSWNYDITFENIILTNNKRSFTNINIDLENLYNTLIYSSLEYSETEQNNIRKLTLCSIILKNIFKVMPNYTFINKIIDECFNIFTSKYTFSKQIYDVLNSFVYEYVYDLISNAYVTDIDKEILANIINYNILVNDMKLYFYMSSNDISFSSLSDSLNIQHSENIEDIIDDIDENLHVLTFKNVNNKKIKYGYYCINLNVSNTSMQYHIDESNMMIVFNSVNDSTFDENMFISKYFNILYPLLRTPVLLNLIQSSKILQKPYQFNQHVLCTTVQNNLSDYQTCYFEYDSENNRHHFIKELDYSYDLYYLDQINQAQTISLNRYLNHIEPCIFETSEIKDFKSIMFKTNNIIFGGANIFIENININKYNPLIVFDQLVEYNTTNVYINKDNTNSIKYNVIPHLINQYEYKHFNDNNLFLLENEFEYESKKLYTYNELLLAESNKIVFEIFTNYVQKRHFNTSISENEILFLFNKYNVTFKSNFIKFDITLTNKLYTLKYIFSLK